MKASQLIGILSQIITEEGDIEIMVPVMEEGDDPEPYFINYENALGEPTMMIVNHEVFEEVLAEADEDEPILTLVKQGDKP